MRHIGGALRPKMVALSHLKPRSDDAGINAPHQVASAARLLANPPKVSSTEVAPCEYAFTSLGETETA
jgi:hypothetical protein